MSHTLQIIVAAASGLLTGGGLGFLTGVEWMGRLIAPKPYTGDTPYICDCGAEFENWDQWWGHQQSTGYSHNLYSAP